MIFSNVKIGYHVFHTIIIIIKSIHYCLSRRMAATMLANPNVYVSEVNHGISRVLNENYSFIVDRPMAMYQANKHCELEVMCPQHYIYTDAENNVRRVGLQSSTLASTITHALIKLFLFKVELRNTVPVGANRRQRLA